MERFMSVELSSAIYDLIDRLDDLRDVLEDARHAVNYEEYDNMMENAYIQAKNVCSDIDNFWDEGKELHSKQKKMEKCSGTLCG